MKIYTSILEIDTWELNGFQILKAIEEVTGDTVTVSTFKAYDDEGEVDYIYAAAYLGPEDDEAHQHNDNPGLWDDDVAVGQYQHIWIYMEGNAAEYLNEDDMDIELDELGDGELATVREAAIEDATHRAVKDALHMLKVHLMIEEIKAA